MEGRQKAALIERAFGLVVRWLPRTLIVLHDLGMVWVCWIGLDVLRFKLVPGHVEVMLFSPKVALVLLGQGLIFWWSGLYRGLWRFASLPDLVNIGKASVLGLATIVLGLFVADRLDMVPRSVLVLYPIVLVVLLGGPRLLYRAWKDGRDALDASQSTTRVLILGAGRAGEALVRGMIRDGRYHPVGFLDDDRRLHGAKVQDVPVLGALAEVAELARETDAALIVIAIPSADTAQMQRIVALCDETGLPFRTLPRLLDVLEGRVAPGDLKEVAIEDLLGREPVVPDWKAMRAWIGGRSLLVTGAGGSIGSELCRQIALLGASRITLVEQSELALVTIHDDIRRIAPSLTVHCVLGDCGDRAVIDHALRLGRPQAVLHAAAYKHVPVLEGQVREAVRNNVLATRTVAEVSASSGVDAFVLISTDKAVDPANVLGATKRLAEMACQAIASRERMRVAIVRFGNVIGSAGSVVPIFREQIRRGGPLTVTHPEVTRYFMTISEACQLILQAAAIGGDQGIFTLDMGEPVPIKMLAEQMIRLAGKVPGRDVGIVYTGLRAGEKMHESLYHADENNRMTANPKILQARSRHIDVPGCLRTLDALRDASDKYDESRLHRQLHDAIPEYKPAHGAVVVPLPIGRRSHAQ
ncbi:MAG TPA: nucleoside-diphosphate sugar epimerase/dehydratase [Xanthomonadaceae bacterium]|jgi:FlaA1/EpsC-like NDP-sugar epimerase